MCDTRGSDNASPHRGRHGPRIQEWFAGEFRAVQVVPCRSFIFLPTLSLRGLCALGAISIRQRDLRDRDNSVPTVFGARCTHVHP